MSDAYTRQSEWHVTKVVSLPLFTAVARQCCYCDRRRTSNGSRAMIEINDSKLTHYAQRIERARLAAEQAQSETARQLHMKILEMYEREAALLRSKS
ncbi:hypothetical protein ACNI3R_15880 [Rhizorhabdus sp. FW153]